ncbi:MAG TPA: acyl-CoA dehydrogenase family protein [Myxococcota bacterium]|nr:acyl-CoA dehydrogenase family protein [Myxococcota bacterium]
MDFSLTPEQRDIKRAAREFARGEFTPERAQDHELRHAFPAELFKAAAELGFVGLDFPEEIGGGGLGVLENVIVIEEFCKADSGIGMAVHLASLPGKVIKFAGSTEQQERWLGPVTRGEAVTAISLTEPDHGSDLTRVNTTIVDRGDRYVLDGTKVFTTNAAYADTFVVLAQDDPGARPGRGMSTIVVERDPSTHLGGELEVNELGHKMGLKMTSSGEVVFRGLEVPKDNLLGEPGEGLANVFRFLDQSRIEIAAQALGNAEGAFLRALAHARTREQFGRPIVEFQAIGHKLARMFSRIQSARWSTYHAAWAYDNQRSGRMAPAVGMLTSMAKHYAPETAKAVIDDAITVFGGYGYLLEQDVERRYRDNRIVECYEGTVEVQLNNMIRLLCRLNLDFIDTELF